MLIQAIAYHLGRLEIIYVITSKNTNADREDGTCNQFDSFKSTVERLLIDAIIPIAPQIQADFENPGEILGSLERVYARLREEGYRESDVTIDVTGGQKTTTVAGAAAALSPDRRFQYVSTRDYRVRSFDLTYEVTYTARSETPSDRAVGRSTMQSFHSQ